MSEHEALLTKIDGLDVAWPGCTPENPPRCLALNTKNAKRCRNPATDIEWIDEDGYAYATDQECLARQRCRTHLPLGNPDATGFEGVAVERRDS